ncbi:MAG: SCO family protein [Anaerolineae bacterium]|nr:SCO family protein [Anaerolineae bacterium]
MKLWLLRPASVAALIFLFAAACSPAQPTPEIFNTSSAPTIAVTPGASLDQIDGVFVGDYLPRPIALQDFTLPGSRGDAMRLSDSNGKWRLLFFGYTHCPDFCPITLAEFTQIKEMLGEQADQIEFVFVSVDGARDTPALLTGYIERFDPAFIAFSGDDDTLAQIQQDYGLFYQRAENTSSPENYLMDHSTRSYLIDPEGNLISTFTYDSTPAQMTSAIQWWMARSGM